MKKFYKLLQNKWFVTGGALFLLFLVVVEYKQFRLRNSVQKEIADLSRQADQIQKNNEDLQNFIAYLKTDSYKEKAAREQLSMKKDGEVVYSFADPAQQAQEQQADSAQTTQTQSNIHKWWQYFFKSE